MPGNFCVDCKYHISRRWRFMLDDRCRTRPIPDTRDFISGKMRRPLYRYLRCDYYNANGECGLFKEKE